MDIKTNIVKVIVNNVTIEYELKSDIKPGTDKILLSTDEDLTSNTAWTNAGYSVQSFISTNHFLILTDYITNLVSKTIKNYGIIVPKNFGLEKYHLYITNDDLHQLVISALNANISTKNLPFDAGIISKRIEDICKCKLSSLNPYTLRNIFNIRIVRPMIIQDNNPPHRDVYIKRLRNAVNIYVPIAGSDEQSSLALVSGSHLWNEKDISYSLGNSIINSVKFTVPAIISHAGNPIEMIRPNPKFNEILVFSPYLIHGGGYNLNADKSRVSLEMRFWKKTLLNSILEFMT